MPRLPTAPLEQRQLPVSPGVRAPEGFGFTGAFHALTETGLQFLKLQQTQNQADVQAAMDDRDQVYKQRALESKQDPNTVGNLSFEQFRDHFKQQSDDDDKEALSQLNPQIRPYVDAKFARLRKQAFNDHFTDYRTMWVDQQRGKTITRRDNLIQNIANSTTPD